MPSNGYWFSPQSVSAALAFPHTAGITRDGTIQGQCMQASLSNVQRTIGGLDRTGVLIDSPRAINGHG